MSLQRWPLGFSDSPSYAAPLTPWASFPPASTVEGQVRRPAELPHVSLIALGGLWRPLGGRQVLQTRYVNPVTVQSLTYIRAETIGPFPGGLIRAGMQLRLTLAFRLPCIGTGERYLTPSAGPIGHSLAGTPVNTIVTSNNNQLVQGELKTYINVLADGSSQHYVPISSHLGGQQMLSAGYIASPVAGFNWSGDFSQPWEMGLWGKSAAETATNITSASWAGGVAVFVNPSHTLNTGDKTTVAGVSNTAYNGVYTGITRIDDNTWSGTLVADPGGPATGGTSSRISPVTSQSYSLELWG